MKKNQKIRMIIAIIVLANVAGVEQLSAQSEAVSTLQAFYIAKNPSPSEYIRMFVTDSVARWQQKGRFETTAAYQTRVTEQSRQQLADRLTKIASDRFLADYKKGKVSGLYVTLKDYDADNQTWLVNAGEFGQLVVPVPLANAPQFEQSWSLDKAKTEFYIDGDAVKLKKMAFTSLGKTYWYDNSQQATFASANVNISFDPIDIDVPSSGSGGSNQTITQKDVKVGTQKSDVDINIPVTNFTNDKTFAVIIANEKYQVEVPVAFAINDGRLFKEYCIKTLGIPEKHIHYVENATLNNIRFEVNWLEKVLLGYEGAAKAIVYYSGHGIPDESDGNAYLLPVDGYGSDPKTGYKLDFLYQKLGEANAASVTYFIDACFSGAKKEGGMMASAKGVAIKAKTGVLQGNSVVFSAATEDETAYTYKEKQHGMFTYFLLKKWQETSGDVSYKELSDYVRTEVRRKSLIENNKSQTPTVTPSAQVGEVWKNWKLK